MAAKNETNMDSCLMMVDTEPQKVAEDLYIIRAKFRALRGVIFPLNMVIVRNPADGTLTLYSPLNPELYADITSLGVVTSIVAPSPMHSTYAQNALAYYPGATLYSSPALRARFPNRDWGVVVSTDTELHVLGNHMRVMLLTPQPHFAEIVLLHDASGSLVVCDAMFNLTEDCVAMSSPIVRLYTWVSHGRKPLDVSDPLKWALWGNCRHYVAQLDSLLEWPWSRVVPCHGDVVHEDAKAVFREGIYKFASEAAAKEALPPEERSKTPSVFQFVLLFVFVVAFCRGVLSLVTN